MTISFKTLLLDIFSKSGMTKVTLAKRLGVSDPYIHALLSGSRRPTISRLEGIRDAFSLDDATFEKLLFALVLEDADFLALVGHIKRPYFLYLCLPLLKSLLDRSRTIDTYRIVNGGLLTSDLWLGWVDVYQKTIGLPSSIRFFLGNLNESGIGLNYAPSDSVNEAPSFPAATVSLNPSASDIEAFDGMFRGQIPSERIADIRWDQHDVHIDTGHGVKKVPIRKGTRKKLPRSDK